MKKKKYTIFFYNYKNQGKNIKLLAKTPENQPVADINKYAIYAYTHGPVTGSGPSVVILF